MDFLEGLLIGPIWSDTEYETRRHTGFYWLVGWLVCLLFAYLVLFPQKAGTWLELPAFFPVAVFIVLLIASPFINRFYYQLNIVFKVLILAVHAAKYSAVFYALFQRYLPGLSIDMAGLPQDGLEFVNQTIARATEFFQSWGQGTGMLLGIAAGGIMIVVTCLAVVIAATVAPAIIFALLRQLQHLVDYLVQRLVFKEID